MIRVKFKKLIDYAIPFKYTREGDACMDMYSVEDTTIEPNSTEVVSTGIALEIPIGFEGIVRGRSGLASKGIHVHIGTIESSYRGDIGIIITNTTNKSFSINRGDRIAQLVFLPYADEEFVEVENLNETERGDGGFGSTGE